MFSVCLSCLSLAVRSLRFTPSILRSKLVKPSISRIHLIEHLIDCDADKLAADMLNNDAYCLHSSNLFMTDVRGFFDQVFTIGFLVISYYLFKRSENGVKEWNDYDDEDGLDTSDIQKQQEVSDVSSSFLRRKNVCPLCNGVGSFSPSKGNAKGTCELCQGSGIVESVKTYNLPNEQNKNNYFDENL